MQLPSQIILRFASRTVARTAPRAFLAFAICVCAVQSVDGQAKRQGPDPSVPIRFQHLDAEHGLSQQDVRTIHQDDLGFMWFGTEDGLNRFDGHTLRVYRPIPYDTTSLSGAWVVGLTDDGNGGMWVATESDGLSRYNPKEDRFTRFASGPGTPNSLGSHNLWTIARSKAGIVWLGARDEGLTRFDPARGSVTVYRNNPADPTTLGTDQVNAVALADDGSVWIGTESAGLDRLNPETGKFAHYRSTRNDPLSIQSDRVLSLLVAGDGSLWVGTDRGLAHIEEGAERPRRAQSARAASNDVSNASVFAILEDPDGALWLGTETGLIRYDPRTEHTSYYRHDPSNPGSLGSDSIHSLFLDRTGVFWIGTEGGICKFLWGQPHFPLVSPETDDVPRLSDPGVWSFLMDREGVLWVGTEAGLDRFDAENGVVSHYQHDPSDPSTLTPGWVVSLFEEEDGTFWVGTRRDGVRRGGLNRFDPVSGKVTDKYLHDPSDPTSLKSDNPWRMFEDSRGRFWVLSGGTGCLNLMDRSDGTFTPFCHDPQNPNTPAYDNAKSILEYPSGVLWLASWGGGLDRFDTDSGQWKNFKHSEVDRNSLSSDYLLSMSQDDEGIIWLGTYGEGLDRFDPKEETFVHYTDRNSALPNNVVYAIEVGNDGVLWLSTNRGLTRFDPESDLFRTFGVEHGLQDLEFNAGVSLRTRHGEMFFGGINGFNRFYPAKMEFDTKPNPVVLTDLKIRGQPVLRVSASGEDVSLPYLRSIELGSKQRDFAVKFAALDFASPGTTLFRYKLVGYDDEWRESGPERQATYTNVDPGQYTLRVQAASSGILWADAGAQLGIVVRPPWFQTPWAFLLYGLGLVTIGFVLYGTRHRQLVLQHQVEIEHLEAEQLRELNKMKSVFFANVSHEFRTPLTLSIGPVEDVLSGLHGDVSSEVSEQLQLSRRNSKRVLNLVNEILDLAKLDAGRMGLQASEENIEILVRRIVEPFQAMAKRQNVRLEVVSDLPDPFVFLDAAKIETAIENLVSNAVKYTPSGGRILIRLDQVTTDSRDEVVVSVRDSGAGIPAAELPFVFDRFHQVTETSPLLQVGSGIGLSLAKQIAELHRGRVRVESEEGFGSTFSIILLKGSGHFDPSEIVVSTPPLKHLEGNTIDTGWLESADASDAENHDVSGRDQTTILVVDDSEDIRLYVRKHLSRTYRVIEATDGEQGVSIARSQLPDLIVSDVMMPKMDGIQLCAALKADKETEFIPIVLLTARAELEDRLAGLREHADDYLTKPFQMSELSVRVDNLILSRRRLRDHYADAGKQPIPAVKPNRTELSSADTDFLNRVQEVVEAEIGNDTFSVDSFAAQMGVDRSHLYRRLRDLMDETPTDLIWRVRLSRAATLLAANAGNVSEVAYAVGFKSVAHFSRRFRKKFGCSPSEYSSRLDSGTEISGDGDSGSLVAP